MFFRDLRVRYRVWDSRFRFKFVFPLFEAEGYPRIANSAMDYLLAGVSRKYGNIIPA